MKVKYIKPEIELIEMELENDVMGVSDGNYDIKDDADYSGPAGAPKRRRSFWGEDE